ncbi:hypothetical protein H0H93_008484 [Arthromyces matolae]|nr:hypothetical protein H0H93_008484 [Arthromyces matolae]
MMASASPILPPNNISKTSIRDFAIGGKPQAHVDMFNPSINGPTVVTTEIVESEAQLRKRLANVLTSITHDPATKEIIITLNKSEALLTPEEQGALFHLTVVLVHEACQENPNLEMMGFKTVWPPEHSSSSHPDK